MLCKTLINMSNCRFSTSTSDPNSWCVAELQLNSCEVAWGGGLGYDPVMSELLYIQPWRISRQLTREDLATRCRLPLPVLASIEEGTSDPPVSALVRIAEGLGVSVAWLHTDPRNVETLVQLFEEEEGGAASLLEGPDPVLDHIVRSTRIDRTLYTLLTVVLQSGDEKLVRAAEVSLRSLVKQVKPANVPWASRQPGHFEPPSD